MDDAGHSECSQAAGEGGFHFDHVVFAVFTPLELEAVKEAEFVHDVYVSIDLNGTYVIAVEVVLVAQFLVLIFFQYDSGDILLLPFPVVLKDGDDVISEKIQDIAHAVLSMNVVDVVPVFSAVYIAPYRFVRHVPGKALSICREEVT